MQHIGMRTNKDNMDRPIRQNQCCAGASHSRVSFASTTKLSFMCNIEIILQNLLVENHRVVLMNIWI